MAEEKRFTKATWQIMEQLLEDISFNADRTKHDMIELVIDKKYVLEHLEKTVKTMNLKKYII